MMADTSYSAQISAWVKKVERRQVAVFRESAQRVIQIAQDGVPVRTGFLRSSDVVTLGSQDLPVTFNSDAAGTYTGAGEQFSAVIANASIRDTISSIYTANYAPYVDANRGFVRLAVQQWPQIVSQVCIEAEARNT